jgi:SAM-dependent methyltransferase
VDTLGCSEEEMEAIRHELATGGTQVDPVVRYMVGATSGLLYRNAIGNLSHYPIPELRLPSAAGSTLLDIGCNWGRWSVAAARKGYRAVGIDPSLGAVLAARRVCRQLGASAEFVVGDARYLPFAASSFDLVFSYSVLQHFSKEDVRQTLSEIGRVLRAHGASLVQMPNAFGIRSLQQQLRRRFRDGTGFEVRYWSIPELKRAFTQAIGESVIRVDGYFGLGIQASDSDLFPPMYRRIVSASEVLRRLSERARWMCYFADSVYVHSTATRSELASNQAAREARRCGSA